MHLQLRSVPQLHDDQKKLYAPPHQWGCVVVQEARREREVILCEHRWAVNPRMVKYYVWSAAVQRGLSLEASAHTMLPSSTLATLAVAFAIFHAARQLSSPYKEVTLLGVCIAA
eukprot:2729193-Amphidinium_carterae.1